MTLLELNSSAIWSGDVAMPRSMITYSFRYEERRYFLGLWKGPSRPPGTRGAPPREPDAPGELCAALRHSGYGPFRAVLRATAGVIPFDSCAICSSWRSTCS